jgi:hypothetical protein
MSRSTAARIAGFTFLLYIAAGIFSMVLSGKASRGVTVADRVAAVAQHTAEANAVVVLSLVTAFCALILGVTFHAVTRGEDETVATLGLVCRVVEAILGLPLVMLTLMWAGTASNEAGVFNPVVSFVTQLGAWKTTIGATFFSVGSLAFAYLLLRGRMIPTALAWLGVAASALLIVCLPAQLTGILQGRFIQIMWIPMALFEIPLGLWLLFKAVPPLRAPANSA